MHEQQRLTNELHRDLRAKKNSFVRALRVALPLTFPLQPLVAREQPFIEKVYARCTARFMLKVIFIARHSTT